MGHPRRYYLSLGSNISPERHLEQAIRRLRIKGEIGAVSNVWQSHAVGSDGPDFLNVCVSFTAELSAGELKRRVVDVIERELGRVRTADKYAPRTIDIDIVMDERGPLSLDVWNHAFVILPMAELVPEMPHPLTGRRLREEAATVQASTWIRRRPDVMQGLGSNSRS